MVSISSEEVHIKWPERRIAPAPLFDLLLWFIFATVRSVSLAFITRQQMTAKSAKQAFVRPDANSVEISDSLHFANVSVSMSPPFDSTRGAT